MIDVGSLSYPSKMPGTSYGLPAGITCPVGSKLMKVKGSTCSGCYALKGNYVFKNVKAAQAKRLASISHPEWVESMVAKLEDAHASHAYGKRLPRPRRKPIPRFHRWHDSGDLQSYEHLEAIIEVARRTPWLQHWLPTREAKIVDYVTKFMAAWGKELPPNLTIRLSATMVDGPPPKSWPLTSTVTTSALYKEAKNTFSNGVITRLCPAPTQGNKCLDCRACWSKEVKNVSYHKH